MDELNFTASKLIQIAKSQLNYHEKNTNANLDIANANNDGSGNYTKYARDLYNAGYYNGNKNGYAWCDVFVDWCFYQLANKDSKRAQEIECQTGDCGAGCKYSAQYYRNQNRFFNTPEIGDQIFFGTRGQEEHTGIVELVTPTSITTIEGNSNNMVSRQTYSRSSSYISGYGRPKYQTENLNLNQKPSTITETIKLKYSPDNKPLSCIMSQSTCYKSTSTMNVVGVLWHSTGANNPNLKRYVQPDDNATNKTELLTRIGTNAYHNDWNHTSQQAGVNAWIGKFANGEVGSVQTLPWSYRPWGCGSGKNGSCNNGWIQFEICEDALSDKNYFDKIYEEGIQLTAYLCNLFNINPLGHTTFNGVNVPNILCHADSYSLGFGTGHSDVNHWFNKFNKTMDNVRHDVQKLLNTPNTSVTPTLNENNNKDYTSVDLKVGDLVSISANATYWNGSTIPNWVKEQKWYIYSIGPNDYAVINQNEAKTNKIMSAINKKFLISNSIKPFTSYRVRVTANALNYRSGPGTTYTVNGTIKNKGIYTIVDEKVVGTSTWGKLLSGAGWINLSYTQRI